MVAPSKVGEPTSTFVRINGKGQTTKALCWDLSRSSIMVAALAPMKPPPLTPMLPAASPPAPDSGQLSTSGKKLDPAVPSLLGSKAQQPQQAAAAALGSGKRPREEQELSSEEDTGKPKVARTAANTERAQQPTSGPTQPLSGMEGEVQQLRQRCCELERRNEDLEERLRMVYSLLRDEKRLNNVVRQLNVLVK